MVLYLYTKEVRKQQNRELQKYVVPYFSLISQFREGVNMLYNKIFNFNISDGLYIGVSLYVQGCPFHCRGCFNPETWSFDDGKPFTDNTIKTITDALMPDYIRRLSILGGEPLMADNYESLLKLLNRAMFAKNNDLWVWIWTGRTFEEVLQESKSNECLSQILALTDYIVDGPFILEQKSYTTPFCGSKNQRVIDVQASLIADEPVLSKYDWRKGE